jgi:hypothetical protein
MKADRVTSRALGEGQPSTAKICDDRRIGRIAGLAPQTKRGFTWSNGARTDINASGQRPDRFAAQPKTSPDIVLAIKGGVAGEGMDDEAIGGCR